jgi:hypothetical protein
MPFFLFHGHDKTRMNAQSTTSLTQVTLRVSDPGCFAERHSFARASTLSLLQESRLGNNLNKTHVLLQQINLSCCERSNVALVHPSHSDGRHLEQRGSDRGATDPWDQERAETSAL